MCRGTKNVKTFHQSTFRNCDQRKTSAASKYQHSRLYYFPAQALQEGQTPQPRRELDHAEDELREVDVQAEVPNVETQSVVHQAGSKPVEVWRRSSASCRGLSAAAVAPEEVEHSPHVAHDDGTLPQIRYPEDVQHGPSFRRSFNFYLKKSVRDLESASFVPLCDFAQKAKAVQSPCRETPERPPFR